MPPTLAFQPPARRAPTWEELRAKLGLLAAERSEWAGLPMLHPDLDLVIEKKFPYQFAKEPKPDSRKFINSWRCDAKGAMVYVERQMDGKSRAWIAPNVHSSATLLGTINAAMTAWDIETEITACSKLAAMIGPHKAKLYFLTGMFVERSKRSGVCYLFRKLRPTVAFVTDDKEGKILACLCLHPVGYYSGTWAGAMVPTDDVIAHLCLMRGSEHEFWKRANQIHPLLPEAGL